MKKAAGFTLIELTVVLLIMAIIAGVVTLKLAGPLSKAQIEDVIAAIENCDSFCRNYARNHDAVVKLKIDASRGVLERFDEKNKLLTRRIDIGDRFKIKKLMVQDSNTREDSLFVVFSRRGLSKSYSLILEDSNGRGKFIFFSGLSGQMQEFEDESSMEEIFDAMRQSPDAD